MDLAIVDLPIREPGIQFHPLGAAPLVVVLPEKLNAPKQPAIHPCRAERRTAVLLSHSVDTGRTVIDHAIAFAGARTFKVCDAATVPELLDQAVLDSRIGLVRQSATRFQRQGVFHKPLAESVRLGCALAWRADHRWPALVSFRDALIAFSRQA